MSMNLFLKKCTFERPSKLSEKKVIKQGVDSFSIKELEKKKDFCKFEVEIIKKLKDMFDIELVYEVSCEMDKDCKDKCDSKKQIKGILTYESNLMVTTMLKNMGFPPFPIILGDFNESDKDKKKKD